MKRFALWSAALLLSLAAAAQPADTIRCYVVGRNKLEVKEGTRLVRISDQWLADNVLPGFGNRSLAGFWTWAQEEFERRSIEKLPYIGQEMPPHIASRLIVEFVIDCKGQIADIRLLAGSSGLGDVAVGVVAESSGFTPARQRVQTGCKTEWRNVPTLIWIVFDTRDLGLRGREVTKTRDTLKTEK